MNIFEQYGIKEVADVTLYSIHYKEDGSGELYYLPALYLNTLKISTFEETSQNVWSKGGSDNSRLISWNFGKDINIKLQDALCSPASLSLCWGGVLSADWNNGKVKINTSQNQFKKIARFEKYSYSGIDNIKNQIISLLPKSKNDIENNGLDYSSSIIDNLIIQGNGITNNKIYKWKMTINSSIKSVSQIPDRFYDVTGKMFKIDINKKISVFNLEAPTYSNYKDAIIYRINSNYNQDEVERVNNDLVNQVKFDHYGSVEEVKEILDTCYCSYLAIIIDNNNNYKALVGRVEKINEEKIVVWYKPKVDINTNLFKGLDLWLHFDNLNEMIYYLITKHQDNIVRIDLEDEKQEIWAYINPETMLPFEDEYWFHEGESYYIKSLTLTKDNSNLEGVKICIKAENFPGSYMLEGETYIKDIDDGVEKHMQIRIYFCSVKAEQSFELQPDGEPVVFDLSLEVGKPPSGPMVELINYETRKKLKKGENGFYYEIDGSTEVLSE